MKRNVQMIAAVVAYLLAVPVALADKLSDFKEAVGKSGCDSIVYSDLKSNCSSEQSYVHDYCDGAKGPVGCGSENITRQLKNNIEKEKKTVEELKAKKSKLENDKYHAKDDNERSRLSKELEQVEKDLYEAGRRVDQAIADLDARKKLVDDAIYNIGKCLDYRRSVMNVFAYAQDKVRGETDPDIVPLARQLRDKWEESKRGHGIAITDKENALRTCKDSRP
jgi:vacuolar-type H+-ATPase subunit I/STV1